ncbi:MAG: choice-of-anchor I family protein [Methylomonas sp.]|nr:choice-of-anchor I family protein [Methylomonas sp.]
MMRNYLAGAILAALAASPAQANNIAFNWNHQWTFRHSAANGSTALGAEIVAYDEASQNLWVVGTGTGANAALNGIDILSMSGNRINGWSTAALGGVNSVDIANGKAAVSFTAPLKTAPGLVRFYDAANFNVLADVTVGANPDAVKFTPNGSRLLVTNEGEPGSYLVGPGGDPVGSVSIIDATTFNAQTAGFATFNSQAAALRVAGVRLNGPNASVAQDLEPEYVAISADGSQAMVTLQENNAVALIDIASATVTGIKALGLQDHSLPGNGFDASDRDGSGSNPLNGNIQNWQVKGMYMPDAIDSFTRGGQQFFVTANEGDAREWPGIADEIRVGNAVIDPALNTTLTAEHGSDWRSNNDKLNRLLVSTSGDLDGDGDLDELQAYGARSFSILDANGNRVFDSGDRIEQIIKSQFPQLWVDDRSDNKGPEPEGVAIGQINGIDLLFLGLERSNAIMVWALNDVANPTFLDMIFTTGNVAPEGLAFFSNAQGSFLAVANEVSDTTSLYRVNAVPVPGAVWLFGSGLVTLLVARRRT